MGLTWPVMAKQKKPRDRATNVALTSDEFEALEQAAEVEGISRSDVLRRAAFRGPPIGVRREASGKKGRG
jgi:hypothetical protein